MWSPLVLLAAVFGACAGAFVPLLAHRLAVPSGAAPRSGCADCGRAFGPGTAGWIRAGAACRCAGPRGRAWGPRDRSWALRGLAWGLRGLVGEPRGLAWRLRGLVGEPRGLARRLRGLVGEPRGLARRLRDRAGQLRGLAWRLWGWARGARGRAWLTVLSASGACGLLAAVAGPSPLLPVLLVAVVLGVLLAEIDLRCLRLPDPLVAALAVLVLPAGFAGSLTRALLAAAVVGGGYLALAVLSDGRLGLGDVKLAAVLAYVLGSVSWTAVGLGVLVPHLVNGSVAVVLLARGRGRDLALGPALHAGTLVAAAAAT